MIYGPDGKPLRGGNTFVSPEWVKREGLHVLGDGVGKLEEARRVDELRRSVGEDWPRLRVNETP